MFQNISTNLNCLPSLFIILFYRSIPNDTNDTDDSVSRSRDKDSTVQVGGGGGIASASSSDRAEENPSVSIDCPSNKRTKVARFKSVESGILEEDGGDSASTITSSKTRYVVCLYSISKSIATYTYLLHSLIRFVTLYCSNDDENNDSSTTIYHDEPMEIEPNTSGTTKEDMSTSVHNVSTVTVTVPSINITPMMWMSYSMNTKKSIANGYKCTINQFEKQYLNLGSAAKDSELSVSSTDR